MTLMLWALAISGLMEVLLYIGVWRWRAFLAILSSTIGSYGAFGLFALDPNGLSGVIVLLMLYRIFNFERLLFERLHKFNLKYSSRKASFYLLLMQACCVVILLALDTFIVSTNTVWVVCTIIMCISSAGTVISLTRTLKKTMFQTSSAGVVTKDLPSITVAIPARNETKELEETLRALVASDYPKLEIIVLDDCSQNKRTPEIIRGFAQDGVRFLAGEFPKDGWLAKNQAYQMLYEAASGKYIVYMGVDVLVEPQSLRLLVASLLQKQKTMMSVLPLRSTHASGHYSITQPMRYFWELVPPRRLFNRPPVLSSCWIIERSKLRSYGSFKAAAGSIAPEAYFAKQALRDGDNYSFLRSSRELGIRSIKSSADQLQTALRTRYPQLHRRVELVALFTLLEASLLLAPYGIAMLGFFVHIPVAAHILAIGASLLLSATYMLIAFTTKINPATFAFFALPVVVVNDLLLLNYSMWKYEFSSVDWKGRNVCAPVMEVIPHLPKID